MRTKRGFIYFSLVIIFFACNGSNYKQGERLFQTNCSTCHMPDGTGVARLYPSLLNIDTTQISIYEMPCIIRHGQDSEQYSLKMVGISSLRDIEINNIINYILNDLNNLNREFQIDNTRRILENCK